jgi:hypothetical protein
MKRTAWSIDKEKQPRGRFSRRYVAVIGLADVPWPIDCFSRRSFSFLEVTMKAIRTMVSVLTLLGVIGLVAQTASAATITWGTVQNITGVSDVLKDGTGVVAVNCGGATTTVNGVSFTGAAKASNSPTGVTGTFSSGGNYNSTNSGLYSALPTEYQNLVKGSWYQWSTTAANPYASFTVSGLTSGTQYAIQIWLNDSRTDSNNYYTRTSTLSGISAADTTDTVMLKASLYSSTSTTTNLGQYVIGTFTADATGSETIYVTGAGVSPSAQINAFQVRAVPEPSTILLLASGIVGLLAYAWRKRR